MSWPLTQDEIANRLTDRSDWRYIPDEKALFRAFRFAGFSEAFGFMARVALVAEKMDHHPDWSNSYDRVEVSLSSHSAGGVTDKDFALAEAMDGIFGG